MADLRAYVPDFVRRWADDDGWDGTRMRVEHTSGIVLTADIVRFSSLTAELAAAEGDGGAESLQKILNQCFDAVARTIHAHGGEIAAFAGDAVIAVWNDAGTECNGSFAAAGACALAIQALEFSRGLQAGEPLQLRIALGAGTVWTAILGGHLGRWYAVTGGEAFESLDRAAASALPGQVALTPAAARHAGNTARIDHTRTPYPGLLGVSSPPAARARSVPDSGTDAAACAGFVPRSVREYARPELSAWLAEFRHATILFVGIGGFDEPIARRADQLQDAVSILQEAAHAHGTEINQLIVSDNNELTALIAWGVRFCSFEDDDERAVRTALRLAPRLRDAGFDAALGIASGHVFAGERGGDGRLEYAIIGEAVNLASRLMQAAAGGTLVARAIRAATPGIRYSRGRLIRIKGHADPMEAFEPLRVERRARASAVPLLGRQAEIDTFVYGLEQVVDGGACRTLWLTGDMGIGKTRLCEAFEETARDRGVAVLRIHGIEIDAKAPYAAWRRALRGLAGLIEMSDAGTSHQVVFELIETVTGSGEDAALVNLAFGLHFPETSRIRTISSDARAQETRRLLTALYLHLTRNPLVVIVEDAHWLDSASWDLLEQIVLSGPGQYFIVTKRPIDRMDLPEAGGRLRAAAEDAVTLDVLDKETALELVSRQLGLEERAPSQLGAFLAAKAGGHPFFTGELLLALLSAGAIEVERGRCRILADNLEEMFAVPRTVQDVVSSRIDLLEADEQFTLKLASVLGQSFNLDDVLAVHPLEPEGAELAAHFETMTALDLVTPEAERRAYRFRHAITRDAAYALLPYAQRQALHRAAAQRYEQQSTDDPTIVPLLADHWSLAGEVAKAVTFLERAGEQAMAAAAYFESVHFFSRLVDLVVTEREDPVASSDASERDMLRRARWLRHLAQSEWDLGRINDARRHFEQSAALLGHPVPDTERAAAAQLVRMIALRFVRRPLERVVATGVRVADTTAIELANVLSVLARIYHLSAEPLLTVYTIVKRQVMLEDREPVAEQLLAYSGWAYLLGMAGMRRACHDAVARVHEIAERVDEPQLYAEALMGLAIMRVGRAEWPECVRESNIALEIFERLGERRGVSDMKSMLAYAALDSDFDTSEALWREVAAIGHDNRNAVTECWGWGGVALIDLRRGAFADAAEHAERAIELAMESREEVSLLSNIGALALAHLRQGNLDAAMPRLQEAMDGIRTLPRMIVAKHYVHGPVAVAESLATLWASAQSADSGSAAQQFGKDMEMVVRVLDRCGGSFPVNKPDALYWRGVLNRLAGNRRLAVSRLTKAVAEARRCDVHYQLGRSLHQLGCLRRPDDPLRRANLEEACDILGRLGAEWDAEQAAASLAEGT